MTPLSPGGASLLAAPSRLSCPSPSYLCAQLLHLCDKDPSHIQMRHQRSWRPMAGWCYSAKRVADFLGGERGEGVLVASSPNDAKRDSNCTSARRRSGVAGLTQQTAVCSGARHEGRSVPEDEGGGREHSFVPCRPLLSQKGLKLPHVRLVKLGPQQLSPGILHKQILETGCLACCRCLLHPYSCHRSCPALQNTPIRYLERGSSMWAWNSALENSIDFPSFDYMNMQVAFTTR